MRLSTTRLILFAQLLALAICKFAAGVWTHINIATLETHPFIMRDEESGEFRGFLIDLLKEFQAQLNFTYDIYAVPDGKYGARKPDGTWDGLMAEVIQGRAQMALAALTITLSRQVEVEFSIPYMQTGISVLFKRLSSGDRLPFTTLLELVHQEEIRYGFIRGGSTDNFFRKNNYVLYKSIGEKIRSRPQDLVANLSEAIERVREGSYAFLGESSMTDFYIDQPPCSLMRIGENINTIGYGLAFQKGNYKLLDQFNFKVLQLAEDGTIHRLKSKYWTHDCDKPLLCICPARMSSSKDWMSGGGGGSAAQSRNYDKSHSYSARGRGATKAASRLGHGQHFRILSLTVFSLFTRCLLYRLESV